MNIKTLISCAALSIFAINASAYTVDGTVVKTDKKAMTLTIKDRETQEIIEYSNLPTSLVVTEKGETRYFKMASLKKGAQVKLTFRD